MSQAMSICSRSHLRFLSLTGTSFMRKHLPQSIADAETHGVHAALIAHEAVSHRTMVNTQRRGPTGAHRTCCHFQHPVHQRLVTLTFQLHLNRRQFGGVGEPEPEGCRGCDAFAPREPVPAKHDGYGVEFPMRLLAEMF